jgi:uncharacterized protein (UPF0335 family)
LPNDVIRAPGNRAAEGDAELRSASDKMLEILDRLRRLEEEKRSVEVGTPEFAAMATEAEGLSRDVFRWSQLQDDLAHASKTRRKTGEVSGRPIEALSPRPLHRILADWREAEVRLQRLAPGSRAANATIRAIERFRDEYQAIHARKAEHEADGEGH